MHLFIISAFSNIYNSFFALQKKLIFSKLCSLSLSLSYSVNDLLDFHLLFYLLFFLFCISSVSVIIIYFSICFDIAFNFVVSTRSIIIYSALTNYYFLSAHFNSTLTASLFQVFFTKIFSHFLPNYSWIYLLFDISYNG